MSSLQVALSGCVILQLARRKLETNKQFKRRTGDRSTYSWIDEDND